MILTVNIMISVTSSILTGAVCFTIYFPSQSCNVGGCGLVFITEKSEKLNIQK